MVSYSSYLLANIINGYKSLFRTVLNIKVVQDSCICSMIHLADASIHEIVLLRTCQVTNDIEKIHLTNLNIFTLVLSLFVGRVLSSCGTAQQHQAIWDDLWKCAWKHVSLLCHHQSSPICINGSLCCIIRSM